MSNKLLLVKSAAKDYLLLNEPFKTQLKDNLNKLLELGLEAPNVKPLTGKLKGLYRIRSGNYRIVFSIENEMITVVAILHRKDAYNKK